jgi:uncharacterized membrane protein YedE/YeeE
MRKIFTLGLLLILSYSLYGQSISDTIEVQKAMGVVFLQKGQKLTPRQLLEISESNPESYAEMKIAKGNYDAGSVFGFTGGFLVGWPLGTAVAGGDPNWTMAAIGAGLIGISIPFSVAYSKHARKAVEIYNGGLKQTGFNSVETRVGLTSGGSGLKINF